MAENSNREWRAVKGEDGRLYHPDGRRVYLFSCPNCGEEAVAAPSWSMEGGRNSGCGSCAGCDQFFHLELTPDLDGDKMFATKWEDYLAQKEKPNHG